MAADRTADRRRLLLLAAGGVAVAAAAVLVVGPVREDIEEWVRGFGTAAPVAFILLYVVLTLLLVPGALLTFSAGVLFGPLLGTLLAVIGGAIGATLAFLLGRRLGRAPVERLAGDRMRKFDAWLDRYGMLSIAVVRIVPGVPYSLLNYAAGVTGMRTRDYILGTTVGLVPGGFAYAAFGGTIDDPTSPAFAGAVVALAAVLGLGTWAERRLGPAQSEQGS